MAVKGPKQQKLELDAAAPTSFARPIEYDLDDVEDLRLGIDALKDPADPVLDWAEVRDGDPSGPRNT